MLLNVRQLNLASQIINRLIKLKRSFLKKEYSKLLDFERKKMQKIFKIKIEYLELRNQKELKKTNKIKIQEFLLHYIGKIRLIDNFKK